MHAADDTTVARCGTAHPPLTHSEGSTDMPAYDGEVAAGFWFAASCATQSKAIAADLQTAGVETPPDREIVALIAYLQKLGKSEPVNPTPAPKPVVNR